MKKPSSLDSLSIGEFMQGPYPPCGFLTILDADLGNGDYFGFHWPLGSEQKEPMVCDMLHDAWALQPSFSSSEKFVEWLQANDGRGGEIQIDDSGFGAMCYAKAKAQIVEGKANEAISSLEAACASVPEVCEYWFALAGQLRRAGRSDESDRAALNAFRSNWVFGLPPDGVLRFLRSVRADSSIANDPIVKRSNALSTTNGGDKENQNYSVLREALVEYFDTGQALHALQVLQNYAFMMAGETISFRDRHGFSVEQWQTDFSKLCAQHLGDSRSAFG